MEQESIEVWECTHCGHTANKEQEVLCWKCGEGEMVYRGKFWQPATPMKCPTRWEVIKEDFEIWWKKHSDDPDDPNGFGHNLFQLIFWIGIFGVVAFLLIISGK